MALAACATTPLPVLPPTHPASPNAPEAAAMPVSVGLANDDATQKTDALLKGEVTPAADSMSSMPGMNH
jgi:hypothetical protein